MPLLLVILALIARPPEASAADGSWTHFTSADRSYDIVRSTNAIWCATIGGLVLWDLPSGAKRKFTTLHGLPDIYCRSVAEDSRGRI